jgi:hypothetical protein
MEFQGDNISVCGNSKCKGLVARMPTEPELVEQVEGKDLRKVCCYRMLFFLDLWFL